MKAKIKVLSLVIIASIAMSSETTAQNAVQADKAADKNAVSKPVKAVDVTSEAALKLEQAKQMSDLCPHFPSSPTAGAGTESIAAFENWKKNFPKEYAAYLKIFDFKQ